ncbi:hypothetical protein PNIG_a1497 [Pseudoalteromonas nigrifaciens]|uniref:Uncharacterized protein n=1 Tax=Pseudoalteromonas nigrifaciens TaxID=28109 RepID=A0AAC9UIX2_9GAMM|nr:hypothetical protein PNIG_a1497 [Pseudoalteromonas nigrifaciens]SUC52509.1 Uncharacterised protein [Pseudoalteromonas nigrifaciens]
MMHDYMAITGNSSSALEKQKRRDFLKMVTTSVLRILLVATVILLTVK